MKRYEHLTLKRDDLVAEYLNLLNICGELEECKHILSTRKFHPWEGGEGKITSQFIINQIRCAMDCINQGDYSQAAELLRQALQYPSNLGEGRLVGQTDNDIHFLLALCYRLEENDALADYHFAKAKKGKQEIGESKYYNDQPADYLLYQALSMHYTGETAEAQELLNSMIRWAEENAENPVAPDFFAVSLPDLVVFDKDPNRQNQQHCLFVKGIAEAGLSVVNLGEKLNSGSLSQLLAKQPEHAKGKLCEAVLNTLIQLNEISEAKVTDRVCHPFL